MVEGGLPLGTSGGAQRPPLDTVVKRLGTRSHVTIRSDDSANIWVWAATFQDWVLDGHSDSTPNDSNQLE